MKRTVMFVDDEALYLRAMKRFFRNSEYNILSAESGEEALRLMEHNKVDILVTDQIMPNMTGVGLCRKVKELYPFTIRMILSGYADIGEVIAAIDHGEVYRFLSKPIDLTHLNNILERAIEQIKVFQSFEKIADKMNKEAPNLQHHLDYTGGTIKISMDSDDYIMSEVKVLSLFQCLFETPDDKNELKIINTVLARQNGKLTINVKFEAGLHLAVELPVTDEARENER